MPEGRKRLTGATKGLLDSKQDKPRLYPALLGAYVDGVKQIKVGSRQDFVWCRMRGSSSEVVQAMNDSVGLHWDLPILVYRDPLAPGMWKVYGRDVRQYSDWEGASYLPPHADAHSFAGANNTGIDPVWVFKRQYMPMLPRPVASGTLSIYIEADFWTWGGRYYWWPGSGTTTLAPYLPTGALNGTFVTVYMDGASKIPKFIKGDEFAAWYPPSDPTAFITLPTPSQGVPLAAVFLTTGTEWIGWGEIYDLRQPAEPLFDELATGSVVIRDEGTILGSATVLNFVGPGVVASMSGSYCQVTVPGPGVDQIGMWGWDDGIPVGTGTILNATYGIDLTRSGTVLDIKAEPPITGSVVIYDENVLLGSALGLNFAGANVQAIISGTVAHIMVTGTAGGGGGGSGSVVILDESVVLGSALRLNFLGAGVTVVMNGDDAEITIPGGGGAASASGICRRVYVDLASELSGDYYIVPNPPFVSGSLGVAINGFVQRPGIDYEEQYAQSGTYNYLVTPPTGVFHVVWYERDEWCVSAIPMPTTGSIVIQDEGVTLGSVTELNFVGPNVDASIVGTTGRIFVTGSVGGGGGDPPVTGSFVISEEGSILGSATELNFIGSSVTATLVGTRADISISPTSTTATGTFYMRRLLFDVVLAAATGSIVMTAIPQDGEHLRLVMQSRVSVDPEVNFLCYFNGESGTAFYRRLYGYWGDSLAFTKGGDSTAIIGAVPDATAAPNLGHFEAFIPFYALTGSYHNTAAFTFYKQSTTATVREEEELTFLKQEAIRQIHLKPNSTQLFASGTHYQLWAEGPNTTIALAGGGTAPPITGSVVVDDEGVIQGSATEFDFVGAGVTAAVAAGRATITIPGGGGNPPVTGSVVVDDEGVIQGSAVELDFVGAGVTAAVAAGRATITIPGGGSSAGPSVTGTCLLFDYLASRDGEKAAVLVELPTGTLYQDLHYVVKVRTNRAANVLEGLRYYFGFGAAGAISGANQYTNWSDEEGNSDSEQRSANDAIGWLGRFSIPGATANTGTYGVGHGYIPDFQNPVGFKHNQGDIISFGDVTGSYRHSHYLSTCEVGGVLRRILFVSANASNFIGESSIRVYGMGCPDHYGGDLPTTGSVVAYEDSALLGSVAGIDASHGINAIKTGTVAHLELVDCSPMLKHKKASNTPDDEFIGGVLDPKWTASKASAGTVAFLSGSAAIYDLTTRDGDLLIQLNNSQQAYFRQDYTLPDGKSIVLAATPAVSLLSEGGYTNNSAWIGMAFNSNDNGPLTGTYVAIFYDAQADGGRIISYQNGATIAATQAAASAPQSQGIIASTNYLRVVRQGLVYRFFCSNNGSAWYALSAYTGSSAFDNVWLFCECRASPSTPLPIHAVHWIREGGNGLDPW